jgi:threonine/homoserine/homoserine lactone efflux protein
MTQAAFLRFVMVATLATMTPGLDTTLTLRNAVLGGRRAGLARSWASISVASFGARPASRD